MLTGSYRKRLEADLPRWVGEGLVSLESATTIRRSLTQEGGFRLPALLGLFPVLGPLNLGGAEPAALAYCPARRLLAVATKPGAVHVVRLESRLATAGMVAGR